jgi:hypothetical protein
MISPMPHIPNMTMDSLNKFLTMPPTAMILHPMGGDKSNMTNMQK